MQATTIARHLKKAHGPRHGQLQRSVQRMCLSSGPCALSNTEQVLAVTPAALMQASTTARRLGRRVGPHTASCRTGRATSASALTPRIWTLWQRYSPAPPKCCGLPASLYPSDTQREFLITMAAAVLSAADVEQGLENWRRLCSDNGERTCKTSPASGGPCDEDTAVALLTAFCSQSDQAAQEVSQPEEGTC